MNFSDDELYNQHNHKTVFKTLLFSTGWEVIDKSNFQVLDNWILKSLNKSADYIKSGFSIILPLINIKPREYSVYRFRLADFKDEYRQNVVENVIRLKFPFVPDTILIDDHNIFTLTYTELASDYYQVELNIERERQDEQSQKELLLAEKRKEEKLLAKRLLANQLDDKAALVLNLFEEPDLIIEAGAEAA